MEPILRRVGPNWRWVFVRMKIRLVLTMVSCRWKLPNLDHYLAEEDLADESQRCGACVPRPKCDGLRLEAEDPHWKCTVPMHVQPQEGLALQQSQVQCQLLGAVFQRPVGHDHNGFSVLWPNMPQGEC